eukprot:2550772-Pleurochrysis_carterae.AAC.1
MQFKLNNTSFPQWEASLRDWYEMLPMKQCTFQQFLNNHCCQVYEFNKKNMHVSGVDTRSTNMSLTLESKNVGTAQNLALIVETTS